MTPEQMYHVMRDSDYGGTVPHTPELMYHTLRDEPREPWTLARAFAEAFEQSARRRDAVARGALSPMYARPVDRALLVVLHRLHGATLDEIAAAFGITRERVRQVQAKGLELLGLPQSTIEVQRTLDPRRVMQLIRDPAIHSLTLVGRRAGVGTVVLGRFLDAFGLRAAVFRLFRARLYPASVREHTRQRCLSLLRAVYDATGRQPRAGADLTPAQNTRIYQLFGTWSAACRAAGIPYVDARTNGMSRRQPRPPRTHCKHGHALTGDNVVEYKSSPGRRCRACMRARQRARYYTLHTRSTPTDGITHTNST